MLNDMKKIFAIAAVLAAFMIGSAAPARVRTIHHRLLHDLRPLHMQEVPSTAEGACHMARPYNGRPLPQCAA